MKGFSSLLYVGGDGLSRVFKFLALIAMARYLNPALFGLFSYVGVVYQYFGFGDFGITTGAMSAGSAEMAVSNYRNVQASRIIVALIVCVFFVGSFPLWSRGTNEWQAFEITIVYALVLVAMSTNTTWLLLSTGKANLAGLSRFFDGFGYAITAALIWKAGTSIPTFVAVSPILVGTILASFVSRIMARNSPLQKKILSRQEIILFLKASIPLGLSMLLITAYNTVDSIILKFYDGAIIVGVYIAAYKLVLFMISLGTLYAQSLVAPFSRIIQNGQKDALNDTVLNTLSAIVQIGFLVSMLVGDASLPLIEIFGRRFSSGSQALSILVWSVPIVALYAVLNSLMIADHRYKVVIWLTAGGLLLDTLFSMLLIPKLGMEGGALATLGCELGVFSIEVFLCRDIIQVGSIFKQLPWFRIFLGCVASQVAFITLDPRLKMINTIMVIIVVYVAIIVGTSSKKKEIVRTVLLRVRRFPSVRKGVK